MQTKKIWHVNGQHYAKTLRAWLNNFDKNKKNVFSVFKNINIMRVHLCSLTDGEYFLLLVKNCLILRKVKNGSFPIIY